MRVGVLSDTHNLLRPRVPELLAGCTHPVRRRRAPSLLVSELRLLVFGHFH